MRLVRENFELNGYTIPRDVLIAASPKVSNLILEDFPLTRCSPGDRFRVERVLDSSSQSLRDLADLGIRPGVSVELERRAASAGPMWVRVAGQRRVLNCALVNLIHGSVETRDVAS